MKYQLYGFIGTILAIAFVLKMLRICYLNWWRVIKFKYWLKSKVILLKGGLYRTCGKINYLIVDTLLDINEVLKSKQITIIIAKLMSVETMLIKQLMYLIINQQKLAESMLQEVKKFEELVE